MRRQPGSWVRGWLPVGALHSLRRAHRQPASPTHLRPCGNGIGSVRGTDRTDRPVPPDRQTTEPRARFCRTRVPIRYGRHRHSSENVGKSAQRDPFIHRVEPRGLYLRPASAHTSRRSHRCAAHGLRRRRPHPRARRARGGPHARRTTTATGWIASLGSGRRFPSVAARATRLPTLCA